MSFSSRRSRGALPPPPRVRVVRAPLREPRSHLRVPDRRVPAGGLRQRRGGPVRRGNLREGRRDDRSAAARSSRRGRHRRGRRGVPGALAQRGVRGDGRVRALRGAAGSGAGERPRFDPSRALQRRCPPRRVVHADQLHADDRARARPSRGLPRRRACARAQGSDADRMSRSAGLHGTPPQATLADLRHRARPEALLAPEHERCDPAGRSSESRPPSRNRYPLRYWLQLAPLPERLETVLQRMLIRRRALSTGRSASASSNLVAVGYKPAA